MRGEARFRALAGASVLGALVTCLPILASDGLRQAALNGSPGLSGTPAGPAAGLGLDETVRRLPLAFEPNVGQFPGDVKFFTRGPGFQLFLTPKEAVFVFLKRERYRTDDERRTGELLEERLRRPADRERDTWTRSVVRMALEGTSAGARLVGEDPLPGKINYLIGNDPNKWRRDIPTYGRVRVEDVYQGIDLVYYGNQTGRLEYDFVVHPGADPKAIRLAFRGPERLEDAGGGDLLLRSAIGAMVLRRPTVYQTAAEGRVEGSGKYVRLGAGRVGFEIARYDRTSTLVIDPVVFATYLGGGSGNDVATGVALDAAGNIYLAGNTSSAQFPLTPGAFHSTKPPNVQTPFVTKMNPTGTALIYSTFIGGDGAAFVNGMALAPAGSVIFTGTTGTGYPTTPGAYNRNYAAIYVTKLSSTGNNLDYSTYVGHPGSDSAFGLAADASGAAYIVGETFDTAFPTTVGA
ncbi:MAG TPA: SBBP repeat-containing protein, partial [Thermoanaerobaculia bacterium]|nr:SBBP repeat-containing protein [Thermoanaerobaculia bacterium]